MSRPIIYDGVRLFLGAWTLAPRGVDRVDLLYARHLFAHWPGDCFGLLPTPWGTRLYDRALGLRLLDTIETLWRETSDPNSDARLAYVQRRLTGETASPPAPRNGNVHALGRQIEMLRATGLTFGRSALGSAADDSIYLNIGQLGWAVPWTTRWLHRRRKIRAVFMLHDVIPLLHPELVSSGGRLAQRWMLDIVARHATGLITTTGVAADAVLQALRPHAQKVVTTRSFHLPVAPAFLNHDTKAEPSRSAPYFLVCGAIEPRKNHLLLLKVWQRLVAERGQSTPKLVVVGSPAHNGAAILDEFACCMPLQPHFVSISGLSSPGLQRLMANARALLMPSFAEGFGLPIIEALTAGTPVLASDLPAHREVGGELACYLDPADETIWLESIRRMMDAPDHAAGLRRRVAAYQPLTADGYFARVQEFLETLP
jgi:glycosyltransferase involved in cell wall biosynthesis